MIHAPDFERHGWRDKAYRDVFTACPARGSSDGASPGRLFATIHAKAARFSNRISKAHWNQSSRHFDRCFLAPPNGRVKATSGVNSPLLRALSLQRIGVEVLHG
jgi:hypothetical protein